MYLPIYTKIGAGTNHFMHLKCELLVKTLKIVIYGHFLQFLYAIFIVVHTGVKYYTHFLIISDMYLPIYTIIGACTNKFRHLKCVTIVKALRMVTSINLGHFLAIFEVVQT